MEAQELLAHQSRVGGDRSVDSQGDRHATRESSGYGGTSETNGDDVRKFE